MVFYASSHTGVLYDCEKNQQCLLQGHVRQQTFRCMYIQKRVPVISQTGGSTFTTCTCIQEPHQCDNGCHPKPTREAQLTHTVCTHARTCTHTRIHTCTHTHAHIHIHVHTQGNPITCTAVSGDRRWLVTADEGEDPLLTVWDSFSG